MVEVSIEWKICKLIVQLNCDYEKTKKCPGKASFHGVMGLANYSVGSKLSQVSKGPLVKSDNDDILLA